MDAIQKGYTRAMLQDLKLHELCFFDEIVTGLLLNEYDPEYIDFILECITDLKNIIIKKEVKRDGTNKSSISL